MDRIERVHLDLVGGIAGDMFAAALADAFPEHVPGLLAELEKLPAPAGASVRLVPFSDGVLGGRRFVVAPDGPALHGHVGLGEMERRLTGAGLDPAVLDHALALVRALAQAEAAVHGIAPEEVEFHELGAWDSTVDFVAAAYLVARVGARTWTWSPVPLGGGRARTAHGALPVPAPATVELLRGMEVLDDGVGGERTTPTGAAILRHLRSRFPGAAAAAPARIAATGNGFGAMRLPGIPNVVRCLAFAAVEALPAPHDEEIATLQFEIDDQSAEDLAVALDRIRAAEGVLEVYQLAAYGKKGRLATQVQVLARVEAAQAVAETCLAQTTTLGLRIARAWRRTLPRASVDTTAGVRVKVAGRPSGDLTAKAEMDDLARLEGGRAGRQAARERAEDEALAGTKGHGRRSHD